MQVICPCILRCPAGTLGGGVSGLSKVFYINRRNDLTYFTCSHRKVRNERIITYSHIRDSSPKTDKFHDHRISSYKIQLSLLTRMRQNLKCTIKALRAFSTEIKGSGSKGNNQFITIYENCLLVSLALVSVSYT